MRPVMMPRPISPPTTPPAIVPVLSFLDIELSLPPVAKAPIVEMVEAVVMDTTPVDLEAPISVDSGAAE
jgi:hypothetical protein